MDNNSTNSYFNALYIQLHRSKYNMYNSASVQTHDDDYSTDSEDSVKVVVISNCK